MIIGHGVDVLELSRLDSIFSKDDLVQKFAKRICSPDEYLVFCDKFLNNIQKSKNFLAKKFSSKESMSKAIGCGIGEFLSFQDITINKNNFGKPQVEMNEKIIQAINDTNQLSLKKKQIQLSISISDDKSIVFTSAILSFLTFTS